MPAFFYTPAVPLANQQKNVSQPIMLANFQAIQELITQDHVDFNGPNFGHHKSSTYIDQTGNTPIFNGWNGLWSENYTVTGKPEIWVNTYNNVPANSLQFPITASVLSTTPAPTVSSSGWTFLPSGILLKWGSTNVIGNQPVTFPAAGNIPAFTGIITIYLTISDNNTVSDSDTAIRLVSVDPLFTKFNAWGSPRTTTGNKNTFFTYLAIGY